MSFLSIIVPAISTRAKDTAPLKESEHKKKINENCYLNMETVHSL